MEIQRIKLKNIERVENSRAKIGDVSDLMQSIKTDGLLSPLVVAPSFSGENGKMVLVAGNRRFEALQKMGYSYADCCVREDVQDEKDIIILNLVENSQRTDISPWEQGRFIHALHEEMGMSLTEISVRMGKSKNYVVQCFTVFQKTPAEFKTKVSFSESKRGLGRGKLPVTIAHAIEKVCARAEYSDERRKEFYALALKHELSHLDIQEISKLTGNGLSMKQAVKLLGELMTVRAAFVVNDKEAKQLTKKYSCSISALLRKMSYGEIKEKFTRPATVPGEDQV